MKKEKVLQLYDMYFQNVYRLALSYLHSPEDAEDIVQDVFEKLVKINCHISEGKEKTYILTMAANACKDLLRSGHLRRSVPLEEIEGWKSDTFLPEESLLLHALNSLPEDYRTVIHLHFYEGYTIKEISKIIGISESAVSMRLTRGKEMLRKEME